MVLWVTYYFERSVAKKTRPSLFVVFKKLTRACFPLILLTIILRHFCTAVAKLAYSQAEK